MAEKNYLLYGASGHARVILDCIKANKSGVIGVFDDNLNIKDFHGLNFIGNYNEEEHTFPLVISIGSNIIRKQIASIVKPFFTNVIHPSASISKSVEIGKGTVILHHAIIQSGCIIGNHVIINTGSSVDHECILDDYVHISPQATLCGNVTVGEGTQIGANATIIPGVKIGKWAMIGAGSVVIRDVPDFAVVVGNPGKIIKKQLLDIK